MEGGNTSSGRKYARERDLISWWMVNQEYWFWPKWLMEIVAWMNWEISGESRMAILHSMALVCADVCLSASILKNWRWLQEDPKVSPYIISFGKTAFCHVAPLFDHYLQSIWTEYKKSDEVSKGHGDQPTNEQRIKEFNSKQQEITVTFSRWKVNNLKL